jgi:hypothetical protein
MFIAIDILLSVYLSQGSLSCISVIFNSQAAKNVAGSFSKLVDLFKRIHLILQNLNAYTRISLTNKLTELLGEIMAQLLSILALSTRVMTEGRLSEFMVDLIAMHFPG